MSDFWNKPRSLRDIADDLVDQLPDDEIGGDNAVPFSNTNGASNAAPSSPTSNDASTPIPTTGDPATDRNIARLHPAIRSDVANFLNDVKDKTGHQLRIGDASSLRTFDEQDEDYAKGRTKPGKIVTNAPGGKSYHNYGLGFDIAGLLLDGKNVTYDLPYPDIAQIGREHGFQWGGDWSKGPDRPHFERTYGYTSDQLRGMVGPNSPYPVIPDERLKGEYPQ